MLIFHQICNILRMCRYVWHPPIIFIDTLSLALVEMVSAKLCLYIGYMRAVDGFPTIDTYSRCAQLLCSGSSSQHILLIQLRSLVSVETVTFHSLAINIFVAQLHNLSLVEKHPQSPVVAGSGVMRSKNWKSHWEL